MKLSLPTSLTFSVNKKRLALSERSESKGFTLIELLTVVAIIAILSVIAATIFTSTQKNARDGRRRSDIDALAKALEVNKSDAGYTWPFNATWFAGGTLPKDPSDPTYVYCMWSQASGPITTDPTAWTATCPAIAGTTLRAISTSGTAATFGSWKICAPLENPASTFACRASAQ